MRIALVVLVLLGVAPVSGIDLPGARAAANFVDRDGVARDRGVIRVGRGAAIAAPLPDPTADNARLELSGGSAGTLDVELIAARWRQTSRGYRYDGGRGDLVRSVNLLTGENGGAVMVRTRWVPDASATHLEIRLTVGTEHYCARLEAPGAEPTTSALGGVAFRGVATACRGQKHACDIDAEASDIVLRTLLVTLPFKPSGSMAFQCDAAGESESRTDCSCRIDVDPILIPGLGDLCFTAGPGCGAGALDCAGEQGADVDVVSDHNIGVCNDNPHCRELCATRCGELGSHQPILSACEAFCAGGENDRQACRFQEDCPGGFCAGRDSGQSGRSCHCVCSASGLGQPPGEPSLTCNASLGLTIEDVEIQGDGICGNGPPALTIAPLCQAMTTASATVLGRNVTDLRGEDVGPFTRVGAAPRCPEVVGTTLPLGIVGSYTTFGRTTADAVFEVSLRCSE